MVGCSHSDVVVGHGVGWVQSFELPEIKPGISIGERFALPAGKIDGVTVQVARVGTPKGTVHIELLSIVPGDLSPAFRVADVHTSDFVRDSTYHVSFQPLDIQERICCALEITSSFSEPASGATLWATREASDAGDTLLFNGKPRWGHLAYEAHVATPYAPFRLVVWLSLAALALAWGALLLFLRGLAEVGAVDQDLTTSTP
jgi:hypothetical protein